MLPAVAFRLVGTHPSPRQSVPLHLERFIPSCLQCAQTRNYDEVGKHMTLRKISTIPTWKYQHSFSQTWRISLDGYKQHTRQYSDSSETGGASRKVSGWKLRILNLFLPLFFLSVGSVLFEVERLSRRFKELIPDAVAEAGEGSPPKFIYNVPMENDTPWYFRIPWISKCQEARVWSYIAETKSSDPATRNEAIIKLATMKGLSDAECTVIASAIDFRTAVALAHAGARPVMVSRFARLHPDQKKMCLASKFREVLSALPPDSIHEVMLSTCFAALKTYRPTDDEALDIELDSLTGFHHEVHSRPLRNVSELSFVKPCLQALLSHSRIIEQVPVMLKNGAMDLLLVVSDKYKSDHDITGLVVKILSNFACSLNSDAIFEESGVLSLLAEFAASDDVRLSFPARKALHNLDREHSQHTLPPGIYQVFPDSRAIKESFDVDIIFIHGIMGGAFKTWRSQDVNAVWRLRKVDMTNKKEQCDVSVDVEAKVGVISKKILNPDEEPPVEEKMTRPHPDRSTFFNLIKNRFKSLPKKILSPPENDITPRNRELRNGEMFYFPDDEEIAVELETLPVSPPTKCWPRDWLPVDVDNVRVLVTDYDTFITHWTPVMPVESLGRTLSERSQEIMNKLLVAGVGTRPIVWVAHSAGGLVVKQMLEWSENGEKDKLRRIARNTKGVIFCSTPHSGSTRITGLRKHGKSIWLPTVEITELTQGSDELRRIDEAFQSVMKKYSYQVLSFGELCPTLSSVGISQKLVPIRSSDPGYGEYYAIRFDHLNICKPRSRYSFLYVKIRNLIQNVLQEVRTQPGSSS